MSAQQWCKVASNLDTHPKIRRAGRNGREVFLFVLRRNAEPGNPVRGCIPAEYLEPSYLAYLLMAPKAEAAAGVESATRAGLIELKNGAWWITGWDEDTWGRGKFSKTGQIQPTIHSASSACELWIASPIEHTLWAALKLGDERGGGIFWTSDQRLHFDTNTRKIHGEALSIQSTSRLGPAEQATHDRARDRYLLACGVSTMRFSGSEIARDAERCAREIWAIVFGGLRG